MSGSDVLANALDAVSVGAALGALVISLLSLRSAQAQRRMAADEHAEFMRELRARANFEISLRAVDGPEDDLLELPAGAFRTYGEIEVGLKNTGERAARRTILNLVAPSWLAELGWVEPDGSPRPDARPAMQTPDERLPDGRGQEHPGIYLTEEFSSIDRRPAYVRRARFLLPEDRESIPFRAVAQSDDLPEELSEVREYFLLRLRPEGA